MLGYYIPYDISKVLDKYEIDRANCVAETLKILNRLGIAISYEDVLEYARDKSSVGRFDIARALKGMGYVKSKNEAYGIYLDHGGKSYVKRNKLTPFELTKKIRECGGVPVLAHPKSLRFNDDELYPFIKKLAESGLCGQLKLDIVYCERVEERGPRGLGETRSGQLIMACQIEPLSFMGSARKLLGDFHGQRPANGLLTAKIS